MKLWPRLRLLSVVVALLALGCVVLAGWSARTVFATLAPASPSGIGAGIAAALAAVAVMMLCALTALACIEALLQIAHDSGRHRVGVLLALGTLLVTAGAVAGLMDRVPGAIDVTIRDWLAFGATAMLLSLTGWFQRTYRRPAHRGFRDFHVDVVDARHALARAVHGA